jgi:seryl-tRNA synthetase
MQTNGDRTDDQSPSKLRMMVPEAARILGISPEAVRARLSRGTLPKEKDADGAVYVILNADQSVNDTQLNVDRTIDESQSNSDRTGVHAQANGDITVDQSGTVEVLQDQIDYLREQLDQERQARTEERRRHDTLMAQLMQRIPEIESPQEPPQASESADEPLPDTNTLDPDAVQRRSWRRRLFGFE